jgi:hypothetical protein
MYWYPQIRTLSLQVLGKYALFYSVYSANMNCFTPRTYLANMLCFTPYIWKICSVNMLCFSPHTWQICLVLLRVLIKYELFYPAYVLSKYALFQSAYLANIPFHSSMANTCNFIILTRQIPTVSLAPSDLPSFPTFSTHLPLLPSLPTFPSPPPFLPSPPPSPHAFPSYLPFPSCLPTFKVLTVASVAKVCSRFYG